LRPGSARTRWGSFATPPGPLAAIGGGVLLLRGKWKGRGGKNGWGVEGIASFLFNFWLWDLPATPFHMPEEFYVRSM